MYDANGLIRLVHATKAVSLWNRKTGPVFWYIAGVPGPFYVNTEKLIGNEASKRMLDGITSVLAQTADPAERARKVSSIVLTEYEKNKVFQDVVATLTQTAKDAFAPGSFDALSGGERRDWLFSIPLAKSLGIDHVFLFKNMSLYAAEPLAGGASVLHVADLINNAASYLDLWLPALEKAGLRCAGTLCVISRGNGMEKLAARGLTAKSLVAIDLPFFEKSFASGLIDKETLDEVAAHFASPKAWAETYFVGHASLFDVQDLDKKSFERLRSFVEKDPWGLKAKHPEFFTDLQAALQHHAGTEA